MESKQKNGDVREGNISFRSSSPVEKRGGAWLVCEGPLFGFLKTKIEFRKEDRLGSLIDLFEAHGEDFVRHLDGLFLLLFQPKEGAPIFLVNNRAQCHRLYHSRTPKGFFFASSLKQLLRASDVKRVPQPSAIRSFLANGFSTSDEMQIEGVRRMLPADYFVFRGEDVDVRSYWAGDMVFDRQPFGDLEAHLDLYEKTYREGLEKFFASKNPRAVGSLLSGGHDTSFLVAQASQVWKKPLHAYTVTFPGWGFDEGPYAENIAKKFGAVYHPIPFLPGHMDQVVSLILANEEPVVGSSLPLHVLSREAGRDVDALLGGDAGDTMWGEYYPVGEYHAWVKNWPTFLRKAGHGAAKFMRDVTDWERFWELEHVASLFAEENYHQDFLRKLCTYRHFNDDFQSRLLLEPLRSAPYARSRNQIEFRDDNFQNALIEGKLKDGFYTYQALHTAKTAEFFGMDLFLPTTDKNLVDFICRLPANWVNGGTTFHRLTNNKKINRRFHKKALSRYLRRDEIYNRSFDIPWVKILRPRSEMLLKLKKRLMQRGWYDPRFLETLFSEFMTQSVKEHELLELKHHGYRLFTLLSLEVWCMEYLDGRFSADDPNLRLEDYL